jgi:hypothetical protein
VPDGVTRVRWLYRGLGRYLGDRVTIDPTVRNNIAASRVVRSQGLLMTATWYGRNGRVIAYYNAATSAARTQRINSTSAHERAGAADGRGDPESARPAHRAATDPARRLRHSRHGATRERP